MRLRVLASVVVVFLLVSVRGVSAQGGQTIAQLLANNNNFTILRAAVQAADPVVLNTLADPNAEITFFAPTDAAFNELPALVVTYLRENPNLLTPILRYHAANGERTTADLSQNVAQLPSLDRDHLLTIRVVNDNIFVDQARLLQADVSAANGVVHAIDSVLIPPIDLPPVNQGAISGEITAANQGSAGVLTTSIIEQLQAEVGGVTYVEQPINTTAPFEQLCAANTADAVGFLSINQRISESERAACIAAGYQPYALRLGTEALVVAVNPANTLVSDITLAELETLFTTAVNWSDVRTGWPEEPILRYLPAPTESAFSFFAQVVMAGDEAGLLAANTENVYENPDVLIRGVELEPFAVAFIGYGDVQQKATSLVPLAVEGQLPGLRAVQNGNYVLSRPLFVYTTGSAAQQAGVLELIGYMLENVDATTTELGYLPPDPFALNQYKAYTLALAE